MIFGRKRKDVEPDEPVGDELGPDETVEPDDEESGAPGDLVEVPPELDEDADLADDPAAETDETDWRADGPFDVDEVELEGDTVTRFDLGSVILTPWEGMGLQLQVNEATQQVTNALAVWDESGLQLTLFAAPTSGGLAAELREDLIEEAQQAGGSAAVESGPFGPEVRRILPVRGPGDEQLFQESRNWFVDGPRWMLYGSLIGRAARPGEEAAAEPFVEFFRNVIVRRGEGAMVPGEIIGMQLPQGAPGA